MKADNALPGASTSNNPEKMIGEIKDFLGGIGMKCGLTTPFDKQIRVLPEYPGRYGFFVVKPGPQFIIPPTAPVNGPILPCCRDPFMVITGRGQAVEVDRRNAAQAEHDRL